MFGECNVCCLRFITKCNAFMDDTLARFVLTDEASDKEKGKKESLTMCSGYKKSGSEGDSGSIGGGGTDGGVHNKTVRKPELYTYG